MTLNVQEHNRLLARLQGTAHGSPTSSELLDDVLPAYGDADLDELWKTITVYTRSRRDEIKRLKQRHRYDRRPLPVLSDPALPCVLERLEHDPYRLRQVWARSRDLGELRRLANLWGVRVEV